MPTLVWRQSGIILSNYRARTNRSMPGSFRLCRTIRPRTRWHDTERERNSVFSTPFRSIPKRVRKIPTRWLTCREAADWWRRLQLGERRLARTTEGGGRCHHLGRAPC